MVRSAAILAFTIVVMPASDAPQATAMAAAATMAQRKPSLFRMRSLLFTAAARVQTGATGSGAAEFVPGLAGDHGTVILWNGGANGLGQEDRSDGAGRHASRPGEVGAEVSGGVRENPSLEEGLFHRLRRAGRPAGRS